MGKARGEGGTHLPPGRLRDALPALTHHYVIQISFFSVPYTGLQTNTALGDTLSIWELKPENRRMATARGRRGTQAPVRRKNGQVWLARARDFAFGRGTYSYFHCPNTCSTHQLRLVPLPDMNQVLTSERHVTGERKPATFDSSTRS
jgi:hypothetical protein